MSHLTITDATAERPRLGRRATVGALVVFASIAGSLAACSSDNDESGPSIDVIAPAACEVAGCVGEGVDTSAGAYTMMASDLTFPSGVFGIELDRHYRSDQVATGWFGAGWATVYETRLTVSDSNVVISAPAGLAPLWRPEAPEGWSVAGKVTVRAREDVGNDLIWPTGERWSFGADGSLTGLIDPVGHTVSVERVGSRPSVIRSTQGPVLSLEWENERLVRVTTNDGREVTYQYEGGLLAASSAPGLNLAYVFNADAKMVELVGPAGSTTIAYANGVVASQGTASGEQVRITYDGSTATVQTAVERTYEHDDLGRLIRIAQGELDLERRTFDKAGRLTEATAFAQPGNQVISELVRKYDGEEMVEERVDGVTSSLSYDDQGRLTSLRTGDETTTFEYEGSTTLPIAIETPREGREQFGYTEGFITSSTDATGVETAVGRDALGNPTSRAVGDGAAWTYEFDAEGNITRTTSPSGREWLSTWGPRSTLLNETDALGRESTFIYDGAGRVTKQIGPGGDATLFSYDAVGRVVTETSPDGTETKYEYDPQGRLSATVLDGGRAWRSSVEAQSSGGSVVTVTAPDGTSTVSELDSRGRETGRRVLSSDGTVVERQSYAFEFDRLISSTTTRGSSELTVSRTYDALGRVVTTSEELDGVLLAETDLLYEKGRVATASNLTDTATYGYDDSGRLVAVTTQADEWIAEYQSGQMFSTTRNGATTTIGYDIDGRAITFTDPEGITTSWALDDADRPVERSIGDAAASFTWTDNDQLALYRGPDGGRWSWKYNDAGQLAEAAEPSGLVTTYEYELGQVTRIQADGGDDRDDRFEYNALGQLQSAKTAAGDFTYEYDATGKIVALRGDASEDWSYDARGRLSAVSTGSRMFALSYDDTGRLATIAGEKSTLAAQWVNGSLSELTTTDRDPIRLATDDQGRLASVGWNDDSAVSLNWSSDNSALTLSEDGSDTSQQYQLDAERLVSFSTKGLSITSTVQESGYLAALRLESDDATGEVRFDSLGRPATLLTENASSTLAYDEQGRVASVVTSRPGESVDATSVSYADGERKVSGDDAIVKALFGADGSSLSPLPSSLANPLTAGAASAAVDAFDVSRANQLLVAPEPSPLDDVSTSIRLATPSVTGPVGVSNLPRLAEQMATAEIARLAPSVRVNGDSSVRIPVIDPKDGRLADFNPFVDAAASGLALGVLSQQDGGDDSLFDRAVDGIGKVVGGVISFAADVADLIIDNPIAQLVLAAGTWIASVAVCGAAGVACGVVAAVAVVLGAVGGGVAAATSVVSAIRACSNDELVKCGLYSAGAGLGLATVVASLRAGVALVNTYLARRSLVAVLEGGGAVPQAMGEVGVAKSDLLATLRLERVVAREVPVCSQQVCARLDAVTKDIFGRLRFVESKNGIGAHFTPNQQVVYPVLKSGGGAYFPSGLNGGGPEVLLGRFEVQHWGSAARLSI